MYIKYSFLIISFLCYLSSSLAQSKQPKSEFRGIWIATVVNIDWPTKGGLSEAQQKQEFNKILNFYQGLNFNVAVVQIRTAGDAFYPTKLAPWSRFLTGEEGKAPDSTYNPLKWMIEETHKKGLEFHAWFNPYRATFNLDTTVLSNEHVYYQHPEWIVKYGNKYYFNPGLPEVREHILQVIREVVLNYDIDAIHFDDYFYPYQIAKESFNDSLQYSSYALEGQSLEDWRRSNIDSLIEGCSKLLKKEKPWVQFGVSPFGVWRNASADSTGSQTRAGQTTYDHLYADVLKWMRKGWIDYNVPQLYWSMDYPPASFKVLADWWNQQAYKSNIYIGHGIYKVKSNPDKAWNKIREIPNQIELTRNKDKIDGSVFFSAKSLMGKHKRLYRQILRKYYKYPAFPPPSLSINRTLEKINHQVSLIKNEDRYQLQVSVDSNDSLRYIISYYNKGDSSIDIDDPSMILSKTYIQDDDQALVCIPKRGLEKGKFIAITFLDKYGRESEPYYYDITENSTSASPETKISRP